MVNLEFILFVLSVLIGAVAFFYSSASIKYSIEENKDYLKLRSLGILFLAIGFSIHSFGDYLGTVYSEIVEQSVESSAHVIIFVSFLFFIKS